MNFRSVRRAIRQAGGQLDTSGFSLKHFFRQQEKDRLSFLILCLSCLTLLILIRLFNLQVLQYGFYATAASDQHEIQRILRADRGEVYMRDHSEPGELFLAATNRPYYQVYAVPRQITEPEHVAEQLEPLVKKSKDELLALLAKEDDPYEPIERKVSKERFEEIKELDLVGIYGIEETYRYYVNDSIGSHILGFVGVKDERPTGFYGVEGYFQDILAGQEGFFQTEKDVAGRWIALSEKEITEAVDGADITLTVDRTLQYVICKGLDEAVQRHGAEGGAVVVMEPQTGRILSMCSSPSFNPNFYSEVSSTSVYNNKAIFEAYEPGSIFKPVVMAGAIDLDYVRPATTFTDTGSVEIDRFTIRNADGKVYGEQTMSGVLDNSINTGMIFVSRQMGRTSFNDYLERFGFGELTGIELQTESRGNISSIYQPSEVYTATASFGQGITVTPLQMAAAYSAIANGGHLMKPYIVEEINYEDGHSEKRNPGVLRDVISPKTSILMTGMLTSVVSNGHAGNAGVPGYYVAGKTGTAQIAGHDGKYREDATNHSFVGYAPADDPRFVMVVKLDEPKSARFSASTAAPLFGDLAEFILNYYQVQPDY